MFSYPANGAKLFPKYYSYFGIQKKMLQNFVTFKVEKVLNKFFLYDTVLSVIGLSQQLNRAKSGKTEQALLWTGVAGF
jgi:hypothetical protein